MASADIKKATGKADTKQAILKRRCECFGIAKFAIYTCQAPIVFELIARKLLRRPAVPSSAEVWAAGLTLRRRFWTLDNRVGVSGFIVAGRTRIDGKGAISFN